MKFGRSKLVLVLTLLGALMFGAVAPAHDHKRGDTPPLPFEPAEELVYEGELSRSVFRGIDIADLRFTAERTPAEAKAGSPNTTTMLRFTAEAVTKGLFRKLFGLRFRQRIESTVEPSSFTVLRTTKLDEQGDRQRRSEAIFDPGAGRVVWTERDPNDPTREARVVTSEFSGVVQDIASVFYFLRTQRLAPGKRFEITVSDSGRFYRLPISVIEKKKMKTVLGEVSTLRVEPEMFGEGRLVRGKGKISIWLTDDARHIPVQARISSDRGTINIKLKSVRNSVSVKAT
jgi:Protein of unknown function (DUF3108)